MGKNTINYLLRLITTGLINIISIEVDKFTTEDLPPEKLVSDSFQALKEKKCVKQAQFSEV